MKGTWIALLLVGAAALAGCTADGPDDAPDVGPRQAAIHTTMGWILIEFYCDAAPITVQNFRDYAEADHYDGLVFHRVIQDFMIQTGGFDRDGQHRQTNPPIPLEYQLPNERGTVAMARTTQPNSATSQFFINTDDNTADLGPGARGPGYAVFARVVEGMDVVDAIAAVPVEPQNPSDPASEVSKPTDPPYVRDVVLGGPCGGADEPVAGIEAGFIHATMADDGTWNTTVSAATDYVPFYVLNTGNRDDTFEVQLEHPASWDVTASPGTFSLARNPAAKGSTYPYAAAAYLRIEHADIDNASAADVTMTLRSTNDPDVSVTLRLRLEVDDRTYSRVAAPQDSVHLAYVGTFDDGEEFDSGKIPFQPGGDAATVAGPGLVTGFSYGLLGLHIGETVDIRFPPELGYGYNTSGQYAQFDGEWLNFQLTIERLN